MPTTDTTAELRYGDLCHVVLEVGAHHPVTAYQAGQTDAATHALGELVDFVGEDISYPEIHRAIQRVVDASGDASDGNPNRAAGRVDGARHFEAALVHRLNLDRHD